MKEGLIIVCLCSLGLLQLTGGSTQQQPHHGTITPKLTMVAMVEGKAFFIDQTEIRNRTGALNYCASLGMRLAEITSASQFLALDQAKVEEWTDNHCAWTGGVETRGIQRYAWENSNVSADASYIPYQSRLDEDYKYFLYFKKDANGSYLRNILATEGCGGVLCETILND